MPQPQGKQVRLDITPFNGALSSADDDVQKALETLDQAVQKGVRNTVPTTDATVTTIATIPITDDTVVDIEVKVVGRRTTVSQDGGAFKREVTVFRQGGGGATIIGQVTTTRTRKSDPQWDVTIIVSGNDVLVQVQGDAAQAVNWLSLHSLIEIA